MSAQSFADKLQRDENTPQTSKELPRVHIYPEHFNQSNPCAVTAWPEPRHHSFHDTKEYLSLEEHNHKLLAYEAKVREALIKIRFNAERSICNEGIVTEKMCRVQQNCAQEIIAILDDVLAMGEL